VSTREPLVSPGDVVTVDPDDYFIGYSAVTGTLRMRVIHTTCDTRYAEGLTWLQLFGVRLGPDNRDGPHVTAHVRVKALQANPPQRPASKTPK
jgi:hypothetical protein